VLVVDDEPTMRFCLERLLRAEGFHVVTACGRNEALARIADRPPDVVLLDVVLDDGEGYGLCGALRERAGRADLPVLMMSARTRPDERQRGEAVGADGYLRKPFDLATLKRALDGLLPVAGG
jgi:DNA-binding response OmpR family regulator